MKNYKILMLNKLIDSYENSVLYKGESKRDNKIYFKFTIKNIKDYFNELDYELKEEIDIACNQMESENFIKIYKKSGLNNHLIDKVELNLDNLENIYNFLKRKKKEQKENEVIDIVNKYTNEENILGEFARYISSKLCEKASVKKYLDIENIKECKDIFNGLKNLINQKEEIFIRNFSVRVYGDSKRYEAIEGKVKKILKDFSKEEYTFEYNIIKNYTYVYFKGNITLKIKETFINANNFIGGIAISSKDIENIEYIKVNGDKLITIENLTSFNNYEDKNAATIYLGGYHNSVRQKMLTKIYENNKEIKYYHFGDIDVGGFKILVHLISKTGIKFIPLNMDEDTLIKNIKYAKDLTQNDIKEINRLLDKEEFSEYYDILSFILKKGKKLEQEIISI